MQDIKETERKIARNMYVPKQTVIIAFQGNNKPCYVTMTSVYKPLDEHMYR